MAAVGDWLAVRWLEGDGDWLEVRWVAAAGDWLKVRWVAGEGDWTELRWVAGANLVHPDLKYQFHPRFGQTKCGLMLLEVIRSYLLWSLIFSFLIIL